MVNTCLAAGSGTACCAELTYYTLFCALYPGDVSTPTVDSSAVSGMLDNCGRAAYAIPTPTPSPCVSAMAVVHACAMSAAGGDISGCCSHLDTAISVCAWTSVDTLVAQFFSRIANTFTPDFNFPNTIYGATGLLSILETCPSKHAPYE